MRPTCAMKAPRSRRRSVSRWNVALTLDIHLQIWRISRWTVPAAGAPASTALKLIGGTRARGRESAGPIRIYGGFVVALDPIPVVGARGRQRPHARTAQRPRDVGRDQTKCRRSSCPTRLHKDLSWAAVASYPAGSLRSTGCGSRRVAQKLVGSATPDAQSEAARLLMLGGGASMVYHFMGDDDIARIMRHPQVSFTSMPPVIKPGAGVPHPRGYGNAARVFGECMPRSQNHLRSRTLSGR